MIQPTVSVRKSDEVSTNRTARRVDRPRDPRSTPLYRVLVDHLETLLAIEKDDPMALRSRQGLGPLPAHVERTARAFFRFDPSHNEVKVLPGDREGIIDLASPRPETAFRAGGIRLQASGFRQVVVSHSLDIHPEAPHLFLTPDA